MADRSDSGVDGPRYRGALRRAVAGPNWGILGAPWSDYDPPFASWSTLVSWLLELFWCMIFGFALNSARAYTTVNPGDVVVNSLFTGLSAAVVFLLAWLWTVDYGLKRHMNWAITFGHFIATMTSRLYALVANRKDDDTTKIVNKYGLGAVLYYGAAQTIGAILSGLILRVFALGVPVAQPVTAGSVSFGWGWFVEIFGSFIIVLAVLYNDITHQEQDNNVSRKKETEFTNHVRTGFLSALAMVGVYVICFPLGGYSFGNVPVISSYFSNDPIAPTHPHTAKLLIAPLLGAVLAGIVGPLFAMLTDNSRIRKAMWTLPAERRMYVSSRSATPLTERLLSSNARRNDKLRVGAFE